MRKRLFAMAALALAVALVVVGCGSSGDDETASASDPKAEFIEKSAAFCAKSLKSLEAQFDAYMKENGLEGGKKPTKAQSEEIARMLNYSVQISIDAYRQAKSPPSGEEKQVYAIRGALEEALPEATTILPATSTAQYARASRLARAHGFQICSLNRQSGDTAVTSKAGFAEEVDATCTEVLAPIEEEYNSYVNEIGAAEAEASGRLPRAQQEKMHEILDSATRAQLEVIGEFDPPKGDGDRIAAILASLERALKESEEGPGIAALETPAYEKAGALAHAYGLAACHLK